MYYTIIGTFIAAGSLVSYSPYLWCRSRTLWGKDSDEFKRYPWKRGDSPLTTSPEYEDYIYDQLDKETYSDYWKQIGLNCEEYIDQFSDIPALLLSG